MGKTPYTIKGRWGEYTVRFIKRGARAAPNLQQFPRFLWLLLLECKQ